MVTTFKGFLYLFPIIGLESSELISHKELACNVIVEWGKTKQLLGKQSNLAMTLMSKILQE